MGRLSCLSILLSLLRIWEQFLNLNLKHMISINSSSPFSFFPLFFPVCFFHLPIWVSAALSEEQGKSPPKLPSRRLRSLGLSLLQILLTTSDVQNFSPSLSVAVVSVVKLP